MSPTLRPPWTALTVDLTLGLVLLVLSLWLGDRIIDAVYQGNPKIDYVSPQARPLVSWAWVATAVQLACIVVCRRVPLVAWLVSSAMLLVHVVDIARLEALAPHPVGVAPLVPSDVAVLVALFMLTTRRRLRVAAAVFVATLGLAIYASHLPRFGPHTTTAVLLAALAGATFASGLAARSRTAYLDSLLQHNVDLDRARVQEAELAVVNERNRLSREIHDTVAHALGVIVVQAQGAAAAQARRPELTNAALTAIVDIGREALAEMRTLLSTDADADIGERAPLRGIRDIPALIQQLRDTGADVDLDMPTIDDPLPRSVDHSLYRIVQESMTNAVKHTQADLRIAVRIRAEEGYVAVYVHNSGAPRRPSDVIPGGHGLEGMRERVAVLGGTIEAGFGSDRGFTVHVQLPTTDQT